MDPTTTKPGDLQGTAASTVHDVLERAENAVGDAAEKVKPVVSKLPQAAQAPVYGAVHAAAEAASSMRERADEVIRRERAMLGSAAEYVRASPRRAIGIAFVTGFVIGRFLI